MKTKLLTLLAFAASLVGGAATARAGDIYDIHACKGADGLYASYGSTDLPLYDVPNGKKGSIGSVMTAGDKVYVKLRMLARNEGDEQFPEYSSSSKWDFVYTGIGSTLVDDALVRPQLGIYVAGALRYATYVGRLTTKELIGSEIMTDLIFEYVTQPGDFAQPVVLAVKGTDGKPFPATDTQNAYTFYMNPLGESDWSLRFVMKDSSYVTAQMTVGNVASGYPVGSIERIKDWTLHQANYCVRTVDFDAKWEQEGTLWRSVHEDSTITVGVPPQLVAQAASSQSVTLYVWSMEEGAVEIPAGVDTEMPDPSDPTKTIVRKVAPVTLAAGATSVDFTIRGAIGGEGKTSTLVLSAYKGFTKDNSTGAIWPDYVERPVKCVEPLPPSVIVEPSTSSATAGYDYKKAAAYFTVRLSAAVSAPITVLVHPKLSEMAAGTWMTTEEAGEYVRFSKTSDTVGTLPDATNGVEVTVGPGVDVTAKVYVYCLKGDVHTSGINEMQFVPEGIAGPTSEIDPANWTKGGFNVVAQTPVITQPVEGEVFEAIQFDETPITIKVEGSYADAASSAGYEIWVKQTPSAAKFTQLDGTYVPGEGNVLYKAGTTDTLPTLTYTSTSTAENPWKSQIYVKAPVSGKSSAPDAVYRTFYAVVSPAKSSSVTAFNTKGEEDQDYNEGERVKFRIAISDSYDSDVYAFLKPSDNVTDGKVFSGTTPFITVMDDAKGLRIGRGKTAAEGTITVLDGWNPDDGGLNFSVEVVLRDKQVWNDPSAKTIRGYDCQPLDLTVNNVEPTITRVELNGVESEGTGYKYPNKLAAGQDQTLKAVVKDVSYDLDNGFKCKWTPYLDGAVLQDWMKTIEGNPDTHPYVTNFTAGTWTMRLQVRDKDMADWADTDYKVEFEVLSKPATTVKTDEYYSESDTKATVSVGLTYLEPGVTLYGKVTATPHGEGENPGLFVFENEDVEFTSATLQQVLVRELDGTSRSSIYGFDVKVEVLGAIINGVRDPDAENPKTHEKWCDYYLPATERVYVENTPPNGGDESKTFSPDANTNVWSVSSGPATTHPLRYYVRTEVDNDFTNTWSKWTTPGVRVTVLVGGTGYKGEGYENGVRYFTEPGEDTIIPNFEGLQGEQDVTIMIEDKDGAMLSRTWKFEVEKAKPLRIVAHGPAGGNGTANSKRYRTAAGIGEGRVWAKATLSSISSFESFYNCANELSTCSVFGYGYKVGDVDGTKVSRYPDRDAPVDRNGNKYDPATAPDAGYAYNEDGRYVDKTGKPVDSFLYTWLSLTRDAQSGTLTDAIMGNAFAPEYTEIVDSGTLAGLVDPHTPTGANTDNNSSALIYDDTLLEAIFSREYLASDNMGDINQDGIPDIYVDKYGLGVINLTTGVLEEEGKDLESKRGFNADLDRNGAESPDYLPSLNGMWTDVDIEFGAYMEVRGYGDGLNDAPALAGVNGVRPERVYAEEVDGKWQWTKSCSLSELEFAAWQMYAAEHFADPDAWTNRANWASWSPERPTSPVLADTDEDGFTDGFEYFFWYRATVGDPETFAATKQVVRLSGRRYDPRNPGRGTVITPEEIAATFDPIVSNGDPETAKLVDTDNDGLPDYLEFLIGTNPIDFDTDGDGLPDGWEVCLVSNLDPCDPNSLADGKSDTERNYDGDAMAIGSYALEKNVRPVPLNYEHAKRVTFAVIDANGDTDGVQWYAMTEAPVLAAATNAAAAWSFKADGKYYVSTEKPILAAGGKTLAKTLRKDVAFLSEAPAEVVTNALVAVLDPETGEPVVDPETGATNMVEVAVTNYVAGARYPVRLEAGALIESVAADPVDLEVVTVMSNVAAKAANACWIYGRGGANALLGEVAETAAEYGCLAIARNLAVKKGAVVCAMPSDKRDVAFLHYLCYQEFGFDPRTAWKAKDPLATRWSSSIDGEAVEGITVMKQGGYTGAPTRTRDYAAYDEFLVYSFFVNNGCVMSGVTTVPDEATPMVRTWGAFTTNPQGPNEPEKKSSVTTTTTTTRAGGETTTETTTEANYARGTNGADTDGDGVPDGWELYVMAGPKAGDAYVFANPYAGFTTGFGGDMPESYFSPFVDSADTTDTSNQIYLGGQPNDDQLNEYQEFEGTDSTGYYANAGEGEGAEPLSTTVVHKGEWKWFNKFFPTDPWNVDTDNDGLNDKAEGGNFAYGTPADDGKLWNIPGGGLNPCSVDTDRDGLPDPWEAQFKGKTPYTEANAMKFKGEALIDFAKDAEGNAVGNALQGLVDGMDGTVADAFSYPITYDMNKETKQGEDIIATNVVTFIIANGFKQVVNRDYDRDGLENWQEYLTGTMRCWRYDDPYSPWTPMADELYWDVDEAGKKTWNPKYDRLGIDTSASDRGKGEFWFKTLKDRTSPIYNPFLVTGTSAGGQYFSRVTNPWDCAFIDTTLDSGRGAAYYWFKNRIGDAKISDLWVAPAGPLNPVSSQVEPSKYACCSPIDADSDRDGMDDYYELFHGMNPLLGKKDGSNEEDGPLDLVSDSWGKGALVGWAEADMGRAGYWQLNPPKAPRGNGYDFDVFPWLTGIADADPDGDDLPNQNESLMPRVSDVASHTDPTPLWMTDTSYAQSLTRRFFRLPARFGDVTPGGETYAYEGTTYRFDDSDGWVPAAGMTPAHFSLFKPDAWSLAADGKMNWIVSFEENEGYDTDHDGISDKAEKEGQFATATDPQDADSPRRRQAMYFQGPEKPSALQTLPFEHETYPTSDGYPDDMTFTHFTVECWAKPDSLADATLVERAVWTGTENAGDREFMRKNFQVGLRGGKWFAKFDPVGTGAKEVSVVSATDASTTEWTHLALTYDCQNLILYVNGVEASKQAMTVAPSIGSSVVTVTETQAYHYDRENDLRAIIIGASAKTQAEGAPDGRALDVTQALGWSRYTRFFKGWIDEIRIWDGARTGTDILADYDGRVRYSATQAKTNREDFYDQWIQGNRRYVPGKNPIPELRYHWSFDALLGAENEMALSSAPYGFDYIRATLSRPEGYSVNWWKTILDGYAGGVYANPAWVSWIDNTVTHLPRFDGTTLDSVYWSVDYTGFGTPSNAQKNEYANTAEPYSKWTQVIRNGASGSGSYVTTGTRHWLANKAAMMIVSSGTTNATGAAAQAELYKFTGRLQNLDGDHILPLGGAYAKACDAKTGLWDNLGASSCSYVTGSDADGDGLPDWWEQYADENYRPASAKEIGWDTFIDTDGDGVPDMTAGAAYLRDLARGAHLDENGEAVISDAKYASTADEDKDGMPDEWENQNGLHPNGVAGTTGHADLDPDNDGLSNYQEYLITNGAWPYGATNGFYTLNPKRWMSGVPGQTVLDYFLPVPEGVKLSPVEETNHFYKSEYLGAICSDHDFMENWWENLYAKSYTSASVYDPHADMDGDGWSTFAECRAYMWSGAFSADLIDKYLSSSGTSDLDFDDGEHSKCHPQPAIGVRVVYNDDQVDNVSGKEFVKSEWEKALVVRTMTGRKRTDSTFRIHASGADSIKFAHYVGGYYENVTLRGFLNPGSIDVTYVELFTAKVSNESNIRWNYLAYTDANGKLYLSYGGAALGYGVGTYAEYRSERRKYPDIALEISGIDWGGSIGRAFSSDSEGQSAYISVGGKNVGTIDLKTGEYTLDLAAVKGVETGIDQSSIFAINYRSRIGSEWPQTVWLSEPLTGILLGAATPNETIVSQGRVKEGLNTIEAYLDMNGNGDYDVGEPYGMAKDVPVGWHKVPEITLELTDKSKIFERQHVTFATAGGATAEDAAAGEGGEAQVAEATAGESGVTTSTKVRVVRESIGDSTVNKSAERVVAKTELVADDRAYMTEADVLTAKAPDLDWNFLVRDAERLGIANVQSATYRIEQYAVAEDGTVTTIATNGFFTRTFSTRRPSAATLEPVASAPVYSSAPTFRFTAGEGAAAFELQVAKADGTVVYDSGVTMLGGRTTFTTDTLGYTFTAPIYAGAPVAKDGAPVLVDGENYRWRVAALNAKFRTAEEQDYSQWADFQMDVANTNRYPKMPTGHGNVAAVVRYFGPAKLMNITNLIVVEAFENADFTGQALAQTRVTDLADLSSVTNDISEIGSRNALLTGIGESLVYVRAYIDLNNNGKLDKYEPWGYANYFGVYSSEYAHAPIYSPRGISVGFSPSDLERPKVATVFIEDTDLNKNEIPDCMEEWPENGEATTWYEWAGCTEDDGAYVADNDVMAKQFVTLTMVTLTNGVGGIRYCFLARGAKAPTVGDIATNCNNGVYLAKYDYGRAYGVGLPVAVDESFRVSAVADNVEAVLIHAQVYAENGYCTDTAVPGGKKHTEPFTADDKKHLLSYFEAMGLVDPADFPADKNGKFEGYVDDLALTDPVTANRLWDKYSLKPGDPDNNRDGIRDGWQLYVMFDGSSVAACTPWTSADDARKPTPGGEGLSWVEEYGDGYMPSNPYNAHTFVSDITDDLVRRFHLWTKESQLADEDNDGLSNWAEFLAWDLTGFDFQVDDAYSVKGNVLDYFVKAADGKYVGESLDADGLSLIADHDFMEEAWENLSDPASAFPNALYANRYVYDANLDADEDGWKNWSECRAYQWGCGFYSDIIDTFITGDIDSQLRCFPRPAIGLHVTYNGSLDPSWKSLIVRTRTADGTYPDAIFQIDSLRKASGGGTSTGTDSGVGGMEKTQALGTYSGTRFIRGTLQPGLIVPSSVKFEMTSVSQELTYYWHCTECDGNATYATAVVTDGSVSNDVRVAQSGTYKDYMEDVNRHGEAKTDPNNKGVTLDETKPAEGWVAFATSGDGSDGRHGEIYVAGDDASVSSGTVPVGDIDYRTGAYSIDLDRLALEKGVDLEGKAFRAVYVYSLGAYWPQTVWLSTPEKGYVKEGENTIEAFVDLNEDGLYDVGEPYGRLEHVNIGWHKTPELRIELKDGTYNGVPLFSIVSDNDAEQDTVQTSQVADGTLKAATLKVDRKKVSVVTSSTSAGGAEEGAAADENEGAENGVAEFTIQPQADGAGRLYVVRTSVNGTTSARLQRTVFSKDIDLTYGRVMTVADLIPEGEIDLDSKYLVADAVAEGISVDTIREVEYAVCWDDATEPLYTFTRTFDLLPVAPALASAYENSYYKELKAQPELSWVGHEGYGAFVVQVSETADFGKVLYAATNLLPAASTTGYTFRPDLYVGEELKDQTTYYWRVAELNAKFTENLWSKVASFSTAVESKNADTGYGKLAAEVRYYGASSAALSNVVVGVYESGDFCCAPVARMRLAGNGPVSSLTNAADRAFTNVAANVVFDGIAPGEYYVMAFVDSNGNGVRDAYETWGYLNKIATEETDVWTPVTATVVSYKKDTPQVLVVMEDTDVNQDRIPDSLQDMTGWDPESDPAEDEDGNGLPDDWEEWAGVEPLMPGDDGTEAALDGDVMAYEEVNDTWWLVTLTDGRRLLVKDGYSRPEPGEDISGKSYVFYATYDYNGKIGLGLQVEGAVAGRVNGLDTAVRKVTVVLVHDQVYREHGFCADTAVPGGSTYTKPFTAADKYCVWKYLYAMGRADSLEENATNWARYTLKRNLDNDGDGVGDGWELYVGANPFAGGYADRTSDWDNDGATLVEEYDYDPETGTAHATDPWDVDTDDDGVIDRFYHAYLLWDAAGDPDEDGLSNYAEYLVSEVFQFAKLDPKNAKSNDGVVDYFTKVGELYLGEVLTDHDMVDDVWEDAYTTVRNGRLTYANRYEFDPDRDDDNDGWSNFAEYRAGTSPKKETSLGIDSYTKNEYPVPVIEATVVYNGKNANLNAIVFKAWSEKDDADMLGAPDAIWTVGNGNDAKKETQTDQQSDTGPSTATASTAETKTKYVGLKPSGTQTYLLGGGEIAEGSVKLCFKNPNFVIANMSNGVTDTFEAGEPDDAQWSCNIIDKGGKLVWRGGVGELYSEENELGTVDYDTGRLTIDFDKITGWGRVIAGEEKAAVTAKKVIDSDTQKGVVEVLSGGNTYEYQVYRLDTSYVLLEWQAQAVGYSANGTYLLADADVVSDSAKAHGHVREGLNTFYCFADTDGNGEYTVGEPFGVVRGVDVGWQGASFTVELTESSAITPRVDLWAGENDRATTFEGALDIMLNDRTLNNLYQSAWNATNEEQKAEYVAQLALAISNRVQSTTASRDEIRVRVVRYGIDNMFAYMAGVYEGGLGQGFNQRVVMEKEFNKNGRTYLCEADFLTNGVYDIDWGTLTGDVVNKDGSPIDTVKKAGLWVTNMTYLIVLGDGAKDFRGSLDTNTTVTAHATVVTRRFEKNRSTPVAQDVGIVNAARPTFTWSMPNEDKWASRFGTTYTAFKIQVLNEAGTIIIYDSDFQRTPEQNKDGSFTWMADVYAGDQTKKGYIFTGTGDYTWRVSMYNAKFQTDDWSAAASFSTAVNAEKNMNDRGYGTVNVTVKYAGPAAVLDLCSKDTGPKGTVHVQAFATADFSGLPVAQIYTDDRAALTDLTKLEANARLIGLPIGGTYYIRAYIDSNGNRVKDDWESWGYAKQPVTLTGTSSPVVGLFIEDADTDNDLIPDAYEYAAADWTKDFADIQSKINSSVDSQGQIVFAGAFDSFTNGLASLSTGLSGASLTFFMNTGAARDLIYNGPTKTPAELRELVAKNVEKITKSVKVTAFTLDLNARKATLYVNGEVQTDTAGQEMLRLYGIDEKELVAYVTVKIYRKASLADEWGTPEVLATTIKASDTTVSVSLPESMDTSGFFKVEVVQ